VSGSWPEFASLITDSPKEVIDQAWQIVFRDYLDTTASHADDWPPSCPDLLAKSTPHNMLAIRGASHLNDPTPASWTRGEFKECRSTPLESSPGGIQLSLDKETKELDVVSAESRFAAARQGSSRRLIVQIDAKSTKGMTTEVRQADPCQRQHSRCRCAATISAYVPLHPRGRIRC